MTSSTSKIGRSSTKRVSSIILVVFVLLALLVLSRLLKRPTSLPTPPEREVTTEKTIEISGVKVKDFTQGVENPNEQSFITLNRTKDYHIFYIPNQQAFIISVVSYPFD